MKEYPNKLSASGCDLVKVKDKPTTGFSGTNDSKHILPLDVRQQDLQEQRHTNALVLEHLLRKENQVAIIPRTSDTEGTDDERLLEYITKLQPSPEVILDVGAQILEMNNLSVAQAWLTKCPGKEAVVFCNDNDELCVVDGSGRIELLQVSSFAARLDVCSVFLDEAHTRGIDLRLPLTYRAAVTLGSHLSKDRLVQAAMRLRKLGKGQSVVFCVPDEIRIQILRAVGKTADGFVIEVADVLRWVISETHIELRQSMILWATQNDRHNRQQELWARYQENGKRTLTKATAQKFLEPEARSLAFRYEPKPGKEHPLTILAKDTAFKTPDGTRRTADIVEKCTKFGMMSIDSQKLMEEQERELSPEVDVDAERVIQRPAPAQPREHVLHPAVTNFVDTGVAMRSDAYFPAYGVLNKTSAASLGQLRTPALLATKDFAKTVLEPGKRSLADSYQRSVQWIVSIRRRGSSEVQSLMIISPFEARELLDSISESAIAALHLYRPRYNSSFRAMDKLDFFTISSIANLKVRLPRELAVQLNVFAGQVYFSTYEDYALTCRFLGLASGPTPRNWVVAADGFIERDGNGEPGGESSLRSSPVNGLKILFSKIRRNGEDIGKTHMGMLLEGKVLQASDFE